MRKFRTVKLTMRINPDGIASIRHEIGGFLSATLWEGIDAWEDSPFLIGSFVRNRLRDRSPGEVEITVTECGLRDGYHVEAHKYYSVFCRPAYFLVFKKIGRNQDICRSGIENFRFAPSINRRRFFKVKFKRMSYSDAHP